MIFIDYKDRRPVYEQIVERYQELVVSGILQPDTPLPSVRTQAMELSINPNTIQRAYSEMERRGIICSVKGRGSFIAPSEAIVERRKQEILHKLEELAAEAYKLNIEEATVTAEIATIYQRERNKATVEREPGDATTEREPSDATAERESGKPESEKEDDKSGRKGR